MGTRARTQSHSCFSSECSQVLPSSGGQRGLGRVGDLDSRGLCSKVPKLPESFSDKKGASRKAVPHNSPWSLPPQDVHLHLVGRGTPQKEKRERAKNTNSFSTKLLETVTQEISFSSEAWQEDSCPKSIIESSSFFLAPISGRCRFPLPGACPEPSSPATQPASTSDFTETRAVRRILSPLQ